MKRFCLRKGGNNMNKVICIGRKNIEIKVDEITYLNCKGRENSNESFADDIKVPESEVQ